MSPSAGQKLVTTCFACLLPVIAFPKMGILSPSLALASLCVLACQLGVELNGPPAPVHAAPLGVWSHKKEVAMDAMELVRCMNPYDFES